MTAPTFHAGEHAVQQRVGVAERMAEFGPRVIRDFMPDQHREFFAQLPFVIAGTTDAAGQPWASVLAAPPGFVQSPDAHTLEIRARPLMVDPLQNTLVDGAFIGLLGLQPHTRRRNRMNGIVQGISAEGFGVQLQQSFGNCPKYIQAREPVYAHRQAGAQAVVHQGLMLDAAARHMIEVADTLFIATAFSGDASTVGAAGGVDVSHRGGKPGFVRVDADGSLTMPDFLGNYFFNTLGNLTVNPRAGLLFIDFDNGDLLYLAVKAEIVWDGPELRAFEGAQRLLRFNVVQMRRVEGALPLRWGAAELSTALAGMGRWPQQA
jgi:predicted pyridoxine 5'-phosphate oxidase superfamily flavin-nucleotide-binding protein